MKNTLKAEQKEKTKRKIQNHKPRKEIKEMRIIGEKAKGNDTHGFERHFKGNDKRTRKRREEEQE